ncbi:MAG TPA: hypothetical protein VFT70_17090 [Nocardioides sp.]|nr:hypothetical protein [Nocardioides sp.]
MSESSNEHAGIADEDLPADLRPTDDNPLAQDLDPDEAKSPEELDVLGGKAPEQDSPQDGSGDDSGD